MRLLFYEPAELALIVGRGARVLAFDLEPDGAAEIARRARGTPRVAMRLLRRIRDFAAVEGLAIVDAAAADAALLRLEVDGRGLDGMDRRYLRCVALNYGGGPVGVETMAAALGDERDVVEEVIEPLPDPGRVRAAHAARTDADPARLSPSRSADAGGVAGAARSIGASAARRRDRGGAVTPMRMPRPSPRPAARPTIIQKTP